MDVIISANEEVKKMIKEMPLNEDKKVSPEMFQEMILEIVNGRNKNDV